MQACNGQRKTDRSFLPTQMKGWETLGDEHFPCRGRGSLLPPLTLHPYSPGMGRLGTVPRLSFNTSSAFISRG